MFILNHQEPKAGLAACRGGRHGFSQGAISCWRGLSCGRLVDGNKSKAVVLYCNGPRCQASRQLSEQLVAAGFTNVRRYQLGIPFWRALSGPVEIELEGVLRVYKIDQTAVFLDARSAE